MKNWKDMTPIERDAFVAEKVFGFEIVDQGRFYSFARCKLHGRNEQVGCLQCSVAESLVPKYTTDITAAWEVVQKAKIVSVIRIEGDKWVAKVVGIYATLDDSEPDAWPRLNDYYETSLSEDSVKDIIGDSAPQAICLAALKAYGAFN